MTTMSSPVRVSRAIYSSVTLSSISVVWILEVQSEAFEDLTPIFADTNDPFPVRFKVKQRVLLDFEYAIPIEQPGLWNSLSFTKRLPAKRQDSN